MKRRRDRGRFPADAMCTCGHRRDQHGPEMPAACMDGRPYHLLPEVAPSPQEGLRIVCDWFKEHGHKGCQCIAFCPPRGGA